MARILGHWRQGEPASGEPDSEPPHRTCAGCGADLSNDSLFSRYKVCSACGWHHPLTARERIELLADPGSFKETQARLYPTDPLGFVDRVPYAQRLIEARRKTGLADAVVTGTCGIDGQNAVVAVLDFEFLGGSMGSVVGEKVASACELA
ncbi:MAG TPA: carboxyl transferase domain-containing protein, partial [Chloroflexota bacterium]